MALLLKLKATATVGSRGEANFHMANAIDLPGAEMNLEKSICYWYDGDVR